MYAGVVHGKKDIRYEVVETPSPSEDEILIKVKYTGICGSDVPRVNQGKCHSFPIILGHEFSGEVVQTGEKVKSIKKGDRVAGIPLVPCMKCDDCKKGNYSLCKNYSFIGSRVNGSFAEYVAVSEGNVYKFDESVPYEQGALFEPSSVALHAFFCTDSVKDKNVAIVGCGLIGLFAIQWARILGANKIVAINRSRKKLEVASKLGATDVISTLDDDYIEKTIQATNGKGTDMLFDASGNEEMIVPNLKMAANKAQICMIGTPKSDVRMSVSEWEIINRKELMLTGSWMSYSSPFPGKEWDLTAEQFRKGQLKYDEEMVFKTFGLSQIAEAFELYESPGAVKGKILINCEK